MIVISNSLPKSASTLIFRMEAEIIRRTLSRNGQDAFHERFPKYDLNPLVWSDVLALCRIDLAHGTFAVKTHHSAGRSIRLIQRLGLSRATFCYRDPRDVLLSALDHGRKSRAKEPPQAAFDNFHSIEQSIPNVRAMLNKAWTWVDEPRTLMIRYEDTIEDLFKVLQQVVAFLELPADEGLLRELVERENANRAQSPNFNTGATGRWRREMTPEQIARCNEAFRPFLERFDYPM
jgi:hypothetical protein